MVALRKVLKGPLDLANESYLMDSVPRWSGAGLYVGLRIQRQWAWDPLLRIMAVRGRVSSCKRTECQESAFVDLDGADLSMSEASSKSQWRGSGGWFIWVTGISYSTQDKRPWVLFIYHGISGPDKRIVNSFTLCLIVLPYMA